MRVHVTLYVYRTPFFDGSLISYQITESHVMHVYRVHGLKNACNTFLSFYFMKCNALYLSGKVYSKPSAT